MTMNGIKERFEDRCEEFEKNKGTIDPITREVELIPHFVYSNDEHKIIGDIYLTEEQAYRLNHMMRYKGNCTQDIAFLRK